METSNTASQTGKWSLAMRDGLLLSLITVACSTLGSLTQIWILNFLLWAVKLVGSIWLLWYFMKRYGTAHPEEPRTTGYGIMVCLFSSIICAVFAYLSARFFFPHTIDEIMAQIPATIASTPGMTPEAEDAIYKLMDNIPQIMCVVTLIWDFILGLIISAIIGASTPRRKDPFGDDAPKSEPREDELA
ncbi:MAG: DUF4199 domain-containing protein [Bacteroidales bacterium]|nr:DUF4199 domain-containing protein [Bacteroidales bacterium]